jgi:hypothetical protein
MPKKQDVKAVGVVVVGVLIAGFLMKQFSDVGVVDTARSGYGA